MNNVVGGCGKHPGQSMINCPLCEIEKSKPMTKRFKLLKDLPDCKAGAVYSSTDNGKDYVCYENMSDGFNHKWSVAYDKKYVENNPEFFEEIPEQPAAPSRIEISNIQKKGGYGALPAQDYLFVSSKHIPEDKLEGLRRVMEDWVNGVDIFEGGRQEALADLEETIDKRLQQIISLIGVTENMAYSQEKRNGIQQTYEEIIKTILRLRTKKQDSQRFATPASTSQIEPEEHVIIKKLRERWSLGIIVGGASAIVGDVGLTVVWDNQDGTKIQKRYNAGKEISIIEIKGDKLYCSVDGLTAYIHPSHFKGLKFHDSPQRIPEKTQPSFQWTLERVMEFIGRYASNYIPKNKSSWPDAIDEFTQSPQRTTEKQSNLQTEDKEWEIVAFLRSDGELIKRGSDGLFRRGNDTSFVGKNETFYLQSSDKKIHSVKRTSDGEVFTVGDEVEFRSGGETNWLLAQVWVGRINSITESGVKPQLRFEVFEDGDTNGVNHKFIQNIRHKLKDERNPSITDHPKNLFVENKMIVPKQELTSTICKNCGFESSLHLAPEFKCPNQNLEL